MNTRRLLIPAFARIVLLAVTVWWVGWVKNPARLVLALQHGRLLALERGGFSPAYGTPVAIHLPPGPASPAIRAMFASEYDYAYDAGGRIKDATMGEPPVGASVSGRDHGERFSFIVVANRPRPATP